MDRKEFAILAAAMKTCYCKEPNLLPNNEAMEIWYQHLCDIPFPVAEAALHKWTQTNKWSPSIAELREMAATVTHGEQLTWGESWEKFKNAVRRYGRDGEGKAMESLDPLTKQCAKALGYRQFCVSDESEEMAHRAHFQRIFESLAEREKTRQQVALPLQKAIERLGSSDMLALGEGVTK